VKSTSSTLVNCSYTTKIAVCYHGQTGLKFRPYNIKGLMKSYRLTTEITRFRTTLKIKPLKNIAFSSVHFLQGDVLLHFTPRFLIIKHIHFHPKAYITMKFHQHRYVGYIPVTLYIYQETKKTEEHTKSTVSDKSDAHQSKHQTSV
jgi:hypothetical protein